MSGFRMSGFRMSGFRMSGFRMSGFRMSGFRMSGFRMSGFRMSGFRMSGLRVVIISMGEKQTLALDSSSVWIVLDMQSTNMLRAAFSLIHWTCVWIFVWQQFAIKFRILDCFYKFCIKLQQNKNMTMMIRESYLTNLSKIRIESSKNYFYLSFNLPNQKSYSYTAAYYI